MDDKLPELPKSLADRWEMHSPFGSGGQADVYLLKSRRGAKPLEAVIKFRSGEDEESIGRFAHRLKALSEISHSSVVTILEADDADQPSWYVTPRGKQFKRWWNQRYASLKETPTELFNYSAGVILDLLGGLCELHKAGYTHRDVKPSNIVVIDDRPVLIDLGIVHHPELEGLTGPEGAGNKFVTVSRSIPPTPKLDNLSIASLWIYMLLADRNQSYGHYDWRYVDLVSEAWPFTIPISVLAVCTGMDYAPENACELKAYLENVHRCPKASVPEDEDDRIAKIKEAYSKSAIQDELRRERSKLDGESLAMGLQETAHRIGSSIAAYVQRLAEQGLHIGVKNATVEDPALDPNPETYDWASQAAVSLTKPKGKFPVAFVTGGTQVGRTSSRSYSIRIQVQRRAEGSSTPTSLAVNATGPLAGKRNRSLEFAVKPDSNFTYEGGNHPFSDAKMPLAEGSVYTLEQVIETIERFIFNAVESAAQSDLE